MIDRLPEREGREALTRCCGSTRWVDEMLHARPFGSDTAMFEVADRVWLRLGADDWREAFQHHPRIGERGLEGKGDPQSGEWSREEQSGMDQATEAVKGALAELNQRYHERFGHVFLICATGRSPEDMLAALRDRIDHTPEEELRVAAAEQSKITRLRLQKLGDT